MHALRHASPARQLSRRGSWPYAGVALFVAVFVVFSSSAPARAGNPINMRLGVNGGSLPDTSTARPSGFPAFGTGLRVVPAFPHDTDPIHITAFGDWQDTCVPQYHSHQVQQHSIRLDTQTPTLTTPGGCGLIITSWTVTIDLTPLASGVYTTEVYINNALAARDTLVVAREHTFVPILRIALNSGGPPAPAAGN